MLLITYGNIETYSGTRVKTLHISYAFTGILIVF